jgi:UDP-3-O-[3-hydroxymyristoyl] glucosamine N-acyltransferase
VIDDAAPDEGSSVAGAAPAHGDRAALSASAIAALVGGELLGDGDVVVSGVAALDRADRHHLSLLSHPRYAAWFRDTRAGLVLLGPAHRALAGAPAARLIVDSPVDALLQLLPRFHRVARRAAGVHPTAVIGADVMLGAGVTIEAYAVVGAGSALGDRVWVGPHAVVGEGCRLGADVRLHAHATCYPYTELGDRVVLHAGARVGREGFGWVPRDGVAQRIPHVGRCVLGDDVEIGANSCVDRGSIDDTVIGAGTKIDSLVQVGHNTRLGRGCMIASQVGIAGSCRIEDGVQLGGQAGLAGHLVVGRGATIAAQGGVVGDVPAGETWSGYPARPHREQLRASAALHRLAALLRPLEQLIRRETGQ